MCRQHNMSELCCSQHIGVHAFGSQMGRISHLPYSNNVPLSKEASLLFAYKPQYLLYKLARW